MPSASPPSLLDPDTPLFDTPFCVVDLETTGGSPREDRVTEIAAVRVRGGEVERELATLVDPGRPIPPGVAALTGIADHMVAGHEPLEAVLPSMLEVIHGCVVVAHNARFDTGFLNAGLGRLAYPALAGPVLCTAALARRLVRDEVPNVALATLAAHLRARHAPCHRALADVRATVDVLHALLERAAGYGVATAGDLLDFARASNAPVFAARRHLAADLPATCGIYRFVAEDGEVLYVGKASDLRSRVRSYFGSDPRRRIADLVRQTARVDHTVCASPLEAEVGEQREIANRQPRFNRQGRGGSARAAWVRLTDERFPRLSVVWREPVGPALGPLSGRRAATPIVEALEDATALRRCTDRFGPTTTPTPCALSEMGRCATPCDGSTNEAGYAAVIEPVRAALAGDPTVVGDRLVRRLERLGAAARFEEAADVRARLEALVAAVRADRQRRWITAPRVLVAARRDAEAGHDGDSCEVVAVVGGRLAAVERGEVDDEAGLAATARQRADAVAGELTGKAPPGETAALHRWLSGPGVRAVFVDGDCTESVAGGAATAALGDRMQRARRHTGRAESEVAAKRQRASATSQRVP